MTIYSVNNCACDVPLEPLPLLQRNPPGRQRYYFNEQKPSIRYASVTSILSATQSDATRYALKKWKAKLLAEGKDPEVSRLEAARRGSRIHDWFEQWILGHDPEIPEDIAPWCSRLAASALWKKLDHVICTEHRVCSDEGVVPFAGTLDGLFKIAGQICLFDLKTKAEGKAKPTKQISNEAMCQLQAYRICLRENYGIHVDRFIALYAFPDKAPFPVAAAGEQLKEHEAHWHKRCQAYQLINEIARSA